MQSSFLRPTSRVEHYGADTLALIERGYAKSGSRVVERRHRLRNEVHAWIGRVDGSFEDLGVSFNLLTNIGRDWWNQQCGVIEVQNGPATATSATSVTGTGSTWTASNLATPQLGLAGMRVYMPVTGLTTAPVYGNVVSNTTSVATVDKWWTAADATGTTPAATNALIISPGGTGAIRFMALSTNSGAASAADTTMASEVTTNGGARVLALYAHTFGQATCTLSNTFTASGTITAIHKIGLFVCLSSAGADPMIYETVLNADATLASGDTLAVTWTPTFSG